MILSSLPDIFLGERLCNDIWYLMSIVWGASYYHKYEDASENYGWSGRHFMRRTPSPPPPPMFWPRCAPAAGRGCNYTPQSINLTSRTWEERSPLSYHPLPRGEGDYLKGARKKKILIKCTGVCLHHLVFWRGTQHRNGWISWPPNVERSQGRVVILQVLCWRLYYSGGR